MSGVENVPGGTGVIPAGPVLPRRLVGDWIVSANGSVTEPFAVGYTPKMLSKAWFSIMMITTCLMGVCATGVGPPPVSWVATVRRVDTGRNPPMFVTALTSTLEVDPRFAPLELVTVTVSGVVLPGEMSTALLDPAPIAMPLESKRVA